MEAFTVRDLRTRTGALIQGAEEGKLTLFTKHGRTVIGFCALLLLAKRESLIFEVDPVLRRACNKGCFLGDALIRHMELLANE